MNEALPLFRATCALLGLWGIISTAQWFADMPRWQRGRALGWDLQRLRRGRLYGSNLVAVLFDTTGLSVLAGILLLASLALIAQPWPSANLVWLACFATAAFLLAARSGQDGSDKMALVVVSGAILQAIGILNSEPRLVLAGALWTGGQLTIAYFAAGASKLGLSRWRQGDALVDVFNSYTFGHRWAAAAVRQRRVAVLLAWLIMLPEVAFPLALLAPSGWLCAILAVFFLFHAAIAIVMGLNRYPWAFLAAYPSVLLVGHWLRSALGMS